MDERVMTVEEVAAYLHCHKGTIYKLLKERKLPAFRVGSDWRFSRSSVDAWMKQQQAVVG